MNVASEHRWEYVEYYVYVKDSQKRVVINGLKVAHSSHFGTVALFAGTSGGNQRSSRGNFVAPPDEQHLPMKEMWLNL